MALDIFKKYFEDVDQVNPDWAFVNSKSIKDFDGSINSYNWYTDGAKHIFIFGDVDIYEINPFIADHCCDSGLEAADWFLNYSGFNDSIDEGMSPEDAADSALLRSIIDKTYTRTNAKLTPEEKAVLAKYGLDRFNNTVIIPDARWYAISDEDLANPAGGNIRDRAGRYSSKDPRNIYRNDASQVNYADIARKRGARSKQKIDAITGDKLTKYADDRIAFKNKKWYRDYHQEQVDQADLKYQAAIKKARDDYDKAVAAAEAARDLVDDYHRPQADSYAAQVDAMLGRKSKS